MSFNGSQRCFVRIRRGILFATTAFTFAYLIQLILLNVNAQPSISVEILPSSWEVQPGELLNYETRDMIRGYVIANPGNHFNSIKAALKLRNNTLAHHLGILEREHHQVSEGRQVQKVLSSRHETA